MKAALAKVRRALSRQDIVQEYTQYLVRGGRISAYDGRFVASAPVEYNQVFLVPGREFESLIDRLPNVEYSVTVTEDTVTLRSGRLHGQIRLLPVTGAIHPEPGPDWHAPPSTFLQALKIARPFISDNAIHMWALCVSLEAGIMRATTNVSLVEVDCPGLDGSGQLLPSWAIDYLLSREEILTGMQMYPEYAAFRWSDDSWMRTQLVQGAFPAQARGLFSSFTPPAWAISKEWKTAYITVSEMSESEIEIHAEELVGKRGASTVNFGVSLTPVPENGGVAKFDPKFLDAVIAGAMHFDPSVWPNPAPFAAPSLRGFIVGRR